MAEISKITVVISNPEPVAAVTVAGGSPGPEGDSAYQAAVNNGFIGTEAEWLASLEGANGESAYEVALGNGFVGTEAEWLASLEGPAGVITDAALAAAIGTLDSDTDLKLTEKYGVYIKATDDRFGAVQDSVTDNATAINNAINYASAASAFLGLHVVLLPNDRSGNIYLSSGIVLKTGVVLRGEDRVTLKRTGVASSVFVNATSIQRCGVESLTIDPSGLATAATVRASGSTRKMSIRDNLFIDPVGQPTASHAVDVVTTAAEVWIERNHFDGLPNNVRLTGGASQAEVRRNVFTNWSIRCIYVIGNSTACSDRAVIDKNVITDLKPGGEIRQPITFQGTSDTIWHQSPKVTGNTVIGPNKSWTAADPGTADQISLHHCQDFILTGNTSLYGGDVGITISVTCRRGTLFGNVCNFNDTCGIALGATGAQLYSLTVMGNILMNNGQNRNGDRNARARVGICLNDCSETFIGGNVTGDDQAVKTQQHGYAYRDCHDITFGSNSDRGNAVSPYLDEEINNTNIVHTLTTENVSDHIFPGTGMVLLRARDFGIFPDTSTTQDLTALNAAIVEASAAGGAHVYFEKGMYFFDTALPNVDDVWISGDGQLTILRWTNGSMLAPTTTLTRWRWDSVCIENSATADDIIKLGATGGLIHSRFTYVEIKPRALDTSIVSLDGSGNFFDNTWLDCMLWRMPTHTVPAFDLKPTTSGCNTLRFTGGQWHSQDCASSPFFRAESMSLNSYVSGFSFIQVLGEKNRGGMMLILGGNRMELRGVIDFDGGKVDSPYQAHLFDFGTSPTGGLETNSVILENSGTSSFAYFAPGMKHLNLTGGTGHEIGHVVQAGTQWGTMNLPTTGRLLRHGGGPAHSIRSVGGNVTANISDHVIVSTGGASTVTIPDPLALLAGGTFPAGREFIVKNLHASATCNVVVAGGVGTIDGVTSRTVAAGASLRLIARVDLTGYIVV